MRTANAQSKRDENNTLSKRNKSSRSHKHVAVDPHTGAQVGIKAARAPRGGMHMVGGEWFGDEKKHLRQSKKGVSQIEE